MTDLVRVAVMRLPHGADLPLPEYHSAGAAGMDLRAAIALEENTVIEPGGRKAVPTGVVLALPEGFEAQVRPRSGLALRAGITCLNTPGTIDSDYRGEIRVILVNHGHDNFRVERGDRIAQLVIAPVVRVQWMLVESLPSSARSEEGFGSSGLR